MAASLFLTKTTRRTRGKRHSWRETRNIIPLSVHVRSLVKTVLLASWLSVEKGLLSISIGWGRVSAWVNVRCRVRLLERWALLSLTIALAFPLTVSILLPRVVVVSYGTVLRLSL